MESGGSALSRARLVHRVEDRRLRLICVAVAITIISLAVKPRGWEPFSVGGADVFIVLDFGNFVCEAFFLVSLFFYQGCAV